MQNTFFIINSIQFKSILFNSRLKAYVYYYTLKLNIKKLEYQRWANLNE